MEASTLQSMYRYKAWANGELFAVLAALPAERAEQLTACIRTLNHIHVVDRIFRAHLSGEAHPFQATNTKETPAFDELRRSVAETDAWYVAYVGRTPEASLAEAVDFTFTDGDAGRMSRAEILHHVLLHGAYHRGNVGQMLKAISVAPPRDLYTKFLHVSEPSRRAVTA